MSAKIPDELHIIINTGIPGHQKIQYKPHMTIKDISGHDTKVRFDPLVKLSQGLIDSVPEDLRVKQFFNKGLFESLINYHGAQKVKTLLEAEQKGYVDNNIKVTLDTLFPTNGVLYINRQPYAIVDTLWTPGSWKLDTKIAPGQLKTIMNSKTVSNRTKNLSKQQYLTGQQTLSSMSNNVVYGPNYSGPKQNNNVKNTTRKTYEYNPNVWIGGVRNMSYSKYKTRYSKTRKVV
jgi:hypothetical protein